MKKLLVLVEVSWWNLAIMAGGLLMAVMWIIHTNVHGPTSYDRTEIFLGQSTLFWGSLLGGPPNLLVALGLAGHYHSLAQGVSRMAKTGYILVLIALVIPALADILTASLNAPFLMPVLGVGLVMLALGHRRAAELEQHSTNTLLGIGILLVLSFAWALLPQELSDRINGYRVFGFAAYCLVGIEWFVFGAGFKGKAQ